MNQDDYVVDPQISPQVGLDTFKPLPEQTDVKEPVQPKTTWGKGFQTALAERNWVTSSLIGASNFLDTLSEVTTMPQDEVFNPVQDHYLNLVPVEYRHLLGSARSEGELYRQVAMINQHIDNQDALKTAPITAQLVAGGVDVFTTPWYLFTAGRALQSAKLGTEILKSAIRSGAEFGIAEAINEAVLHKSQITRTKAESIANVGLATTLGGLFGGVGGAVRSADSALLKKMVSETLQGKKVKFKLNKNFDIEGLNIYDDSAGAMRVRSIDMPGSRLLGWGKNGKLRPARPFIWMLGKWARNPVIIGLSSKSPTVVWFTSHTYEHNMDVVKNVFQGSNLVQSLQTKLYEWEAKGKLASIKMNRFYAEYLGLNPDNPLRNALKRTPKDKLSKSDFERLVMAAMASDEKVASDVAGHEVMNRAKKELYDQFYAPVSEQLKELGFLAPDITPAMAVQYINRIYDQHWLTGNPVRAQEFLLKEYTETNTKVVAIREQETILKDHIENLRTLIGEAVDKDSIAQLESQSRELKVQLKAIQDDIQERVLKGEFTPDMLTGEYGMKRETIEAIQALQKPIDDISEAIKNATTANEKKALQAKKKALQEELNTKLAANEIDESLYYMTKTGEFKLRDIDYGTIRLRPIMDETQLMSAAEDTYKTLTNQTEEQLLDAILGSAKKGSGGENPFMLRTLMIDDKKLYMSKFLSSDFSSTVRTFSLRAGRLIEMRKLMNDYRITDKNILEHLIYKIEQEYSAVGKQTARRQQEELKGLTGKDLEKAELRHQKENLSIKKDLDADLKFIEITYKRITGTMPQSRKELMKLARISNNYAYATQLGALSLLQLQDLVAPIFNHGVSRWMKDGVGGFVSAVALASKKDKQRMAAWMSDINVGIETEAALYGLANDVRDSVQFASGWLDTKMAKAATAMGILNFSSVAGNLVTRINAHVSMSDALRRLSKLMDGTIGKSDAIALGNLGLRDEKLAQVILDQYNKHGEKIGLSYVPGWEKWGSTETDAAYQKLCLEARKAFMDAISKDIRSTIFSGTNIASYPLELNPNDATRAFMVYMGWILSASANYAVPLLQRYDQNRVNGAIAMWAAACLVDPLRALVEGKEPDLEPAKLFKKGILNSGVLGLPVALFNTANSMGRLFPELLVDRYANRDRGIQLSAGAPQMLLEAGLNFGGQFLNDDWNQKELKQLAATIPLARAMGFRKIVNEAIKATDLKERPERGNK